MRSTLFVIGSSISSLVNSAGIHALPQAGLAEKPVPRLEQITQIESPQGLATTEANNWLMLNVGKEYKEIKERAYLFKEVKDKESEVYNLLSGAKPTYNVKKDAIDNTNPYLVIMGETREPIKKTLMYDDFNLPLSFTVRQLEESGEKSLEIVITPKGRNLGNGDSVRIIGSNGLPKLIRYRISSVEAMDKIHQEQVI